MTAAKKTRTGGRGGMIFSWLRDVDDNRHADEELTLARRQAIMLVAVARALHADPDGANCYPAQSTIARFAGVDRVTVRAVDAWLIDHALMAMTKDSGRGTARRFRLQLHPLNGGDDHQSTEPKMVATTTNQAEMNGGQDGGQGGGGHHHNLLPPNVSEEEGRERYALSPPEAGPTHALSTAQKTDAYKLIAEAMTSKPADYRQLDRYNDALISEAHRLHTGGWSAAQIAACVVDLPKTPKYSATGLVAKKLQRLPDEPDETIVTEVADVADDELAAYEKALEADPKYWARQIAEAVCAWCDHEWMYIWDDVDDDLFEADKNIVGAVAAWLSDQELYLGPDYSDELHGLPGKYVVNDDTDDRTIERFATVLTSRPVSDTRNNEERAAQLRDVFKRLPEIVKAVEAIMLKQAQR